MSATGSHLGSPPISSCNACSPRWQCALAVTAATTALACSGKTADLGNSARHDPIYAETAPPIATSGTHLPITRPWKLAEGLSSVHEFAVDQGQVFWLSATGDGDFGEQLFTCRVAGCRNTLDKLGEWPSWSKNVFPVEPNALHVDETTVYPTSGWSDMNAVTMACPRTGCLKGDSLFSADARQGMVLAAAGNMLLVLVADAERNSELYSCESGHCLETMIALPRGPGLRQPGIYYSAFEMDSEYAYIADRQDIFRTRLDGTGATEVIAQGEQTIGQLRLHGDSIFWTEHVAFGTVKSCAKAGCIGAPKLLVTNLDRPVSLVVDDEFLYVMEPCGNSMNWSRDRLLRCAITGCDVPTVLAENVGSLMSTYQPALYQDADNLYFVASPSCSTAPASGYDPSDYYIAVVPKREGL